VGEGNAAGLAQSTYLVVCGNTRPALQMHRGWNAAWNLWDVMAAENVGLHRPAYF